MQQTCCNDLLRKAELRQDAGCGHQVRQHGLAVLADLALVGTGSECIRCCHVAAAEHRKVGLQLQEGAHVHRHCPLSHAGLAVRQHHQSLHRQNKQTKSGV